MGRIGGAKMDKKLTKSFYREDGQSTTKNGNSDNVKSSKSNQKAAKTTNNNNSANMDS